MFEDRVLRRIFQSKWEQKMKRGRRKCYNKKCNNFYSSQDVTALIESRKT
jgi:hypothetical protein